MSYWCLVVCGVPFNYGIELNLNLKTARLLRSFKIKLDCEE